MIDFVTDHSTLLRISDSEQAAEANNGVARRAQKAPRTRKEYIKEKGELEFFLMLSLGEIYKLQYIKPECERNLDDRTRGKPWSDSSWSDARKIPYVTN